MYRVNRRHRRQWSFIPFHPFANVFEGDDDKGGGGGDKGKKKTEPAKLELTEEELTARTTSAVEAALKRERDAAAEAKKKVDDEAAAAKAKADGDLQKQIELAETNRQKEADRAAAAERRAQISEVNIQLRDHLAGDKDRAAFLSNAVDIMGHIEKELKPDAKPDEIKKLIADQAKAFIDRSGPRRAGGPPPNPTEQHRKRENEKKQPENSDELVGGYMKRMYPGPVQKSTN